MFHWIQTAQASLEQQLFGHVDAAPFPCVGAKAALARDSLQILACDRIDSAWDDVRIHHALLCFVREYREQPTLFRSLAIVFEVPHCLDEEQFEQALWARVQSLSDKDVWRGQEHDHRVSTDPGNPHFSLSFGGEAFFIVGLHPRASRPARRFEHPALVFNLHDQFERLRAGGKYETMREKILVRDEQLAGSRNPMPARHGEASEARQYSGRAVDADWMPPYSYQGAVTGMAVKP